MIGPFSASLMQKWYDEGYFAPDLLIKRSQLDNEWIMVGELAMHARNGKLFIQLYPEDLSSGFSPKNNLLHDSRPFDRFHHPLVQSDTQVIDHSIHQTRFQHSNATSFGGVLNSYSYTSGPIHVPPDPSILAVPPSHELSFQPTMPNRAIAVQPVLSGPVDVEQSPAYRDGPIRYNEFLHSTSTDQLRTIPSTQGVHSGSES